MKTDAQIIADINGVLLPTLQYEYDQFLEGMGWHKDMYLEDAINNDEASLPFIEQAYGLTRYALNQPINKRQLLGNVLDIMLAKFADAIRIPKLKLAFYEKNLKLSIQQIAKGAIVSLEQQVAQLLYLGQTTAYPAYDGIPFFSTAHVRNGVTYSNYITLTGGLTAANYETLWTALNTFPSANVDRVTNLRPTHLVTHSFNHFAAKQLMQSTNTTEATSLAINPLQSDAFPVSDGNLVDPEDIFLLHAGDIIRPMAKIGHSSFTPFELIAEVEPKDVQRNDGMYVWTVVSHDTVYPGHPWSAVKGMMI